MFDKTDKRFFVVIDRDSRMYDGSHYANIASAREKAEKLANENKGIEYFVCSVDSSFISETIIRTHYC